MEIAVIVTVVAASGGSLRLSVLIVRHNHFPAYKAWHSTHDIFAATVNAYY